MPRVSIPEGMPEDMAAIVQSLSNAVRTRILRELSIASLTAVELSAEIDVDHASVHRHLVALEKADLVTADTPPAKRRGGGAKVHWRTNAEQVQAIAERWARYALGED